MTEWRLLESIEPWGEAGRDYRTACLMAQMQVSWSSGQKVISLKKIINKWFRIQKPQSPDAMVKVARRMAAVLGGQ